MKILCCLHDGIKLYNVRNEDKKGYTAINEFGNQFYMFREDVIGVFPYDTELEVLKENNPEYFL